MKKLLLFTIFLALVACMTSGLALAQSATTGDISGTVTDPSGAVVANVAVTVKSLDKGTVLTGATNAEGGFVFSLVNPGSYSVEIAAPSFKQYVAKVTVQVGQATIVNAKLSLGAAGTTVEVSGLAPLMETEQADMSTAFDRNLVENLPNGGNDLTAVAYTAPGVNMNSGGGYGNFNVNGLPATSNVFTVDGENQMDPFLNLNNSGPTNLMLGKNSIDEATVVTNAYSGQYGQQAGAQVSYVSKGGTNQFHGNAEYEWTGRYLEANNWFNGYTAPGQTSEPAPFGNNNQWAGSFGGPIKKDKAFFFLDTEGIRYIVPSTVQVYSPTSAFLTNTIANLGTVGASAATIAQYTTAAGIWTSANNYGRGTPVAGSCVDPFTGSPVGAYSATDSCFQVYNTTAGLPASETLGIGRLDWNIGNKDRAFLRFDIDTGVQATYADPINPSFSAASYQPEYNNSLNWSHNFGTTATNQFVAAASYYRAIFETNTNGPTSPFPYSLYVLAPGLTQEFGLPSATGLNALNFEFPQGRNVTQYQIVDDFAKTYGKHNLKFGVNFRRYDISNYDVSVEATPLVLSGLQDFYNGSSSEYVQTNSLAQAVPENTGGIGFYVQDEWAVASNFKLIGSLRLEHNFNPTCNINCFTEPNNVFSAIAAQGGGPSGSPGNAAIPYNQALNININRAFPSVDPINYSPRISFTWSPTNDRKTVLSGGFGIFYDAFPAFITDGFVNAPFTVGVPLIGPDFGGAPTAWADPAGAAQAVVNTANIIRNGAAGVPNLQNGLTLAQLTAAGGVPFNVTSFPGKLKTPQYQEWNFQIQRELDSKSRITLAYVGNHGIHEPYPNSTVDAYSPYAIAGYPAAPIDPRFATVTQWNSGANSNYNGMNASFTRRMTYGFVVNANFNWAHSLDEISNGGLLPYSVSSLQGQINPANLAANNYGNADYDIRKSFNANYVWTEPYHFSNKIMNGILGGWMGTENFIVRGGLPYTVIDGTVATDDGGLTVPAQVLGPGQQSCVNANSACFNSAAFTSSSGSGVFPNQTRNQYRGPNFFDSDFSLMKGFQATERIKVNIGMTVYNVFNHPSFQNPGSAWTGSTCSSTAQTPGLAQPDCGDIHGVAAPPTGPYGSFAQGLPAARMGQFVAKINF